MSVIKRHPVELAISAANFMHSSFKIFPPIKRIDLSFLSASIDLGIKDSSIFFDLICFNGGGIFPLNSPQAQSAGTIKEEI